MVNFSNLKKLLKLRLTSKTEKNLLTNFSATTSYIYDSYGYPTKETTSFSDGIIKTSQIRYSYRNTVASGYYLGYPLDKTVSTIRNGENCTERYFIPAQGYCRPIVEVKYINGQQVVQNNYAYDTHGNILKQVNKKYSASNNEETTYTYDSYGRVSSSTDRFGLTTKYSYDDLGRMHTSIDNKNLVTSYTYDAFGRNDSIISPDGTVSRTTLAWSTDGPNAVYSLTSIATGKPTEIKMYDALNREVKIGVVRTNGKTASVMKTYDDYGNLQRESLPYISSSNSPIWKVYQYDQYNRLLSLSEGNERKTTYNYSRNKTTTIEDGVSITREYDSQGSLVSVTDAAETIKYTMSPFGQPATIEAPGNIKTIISYDSYGRRISMNDPSLGETTFTYDASGNVDSETNAKGETINYTYDNHNRLIGKKLKEFSTSYTYDDEGNLTNVTSDNGTGKVYSYDKFGRLASSKETIVDGKWLLKEYAYGNGNITSIKYTTQAGSILTENYTYANGYLSEGKINDNTIVYKLNEENANGQPLKVTTCGLSRIYKYTDYGLPSYRNINGFRTHYQDINYSFESKTHNLITISNNIKGKVENFTYDDLNRLTSFNGNQVDYDDNGNILSKGDIGNFKYEIDDKPYAVSEITPSSTDMPMRQQLVCYTSFYRPDSIKENGKTAAFVYNDSYERVKMTIAANGQDKLRRYYMGSDYELDETSSTSKEKLYLFGDYYSSPVVYVKENGRGNLYSIIRDYHGSITHILDTEGKLIQEVNYDAWGRLRDANTYKLYSVDKEPTLFLGRGYTGHEHLQDFGLINMNARLYDSFVGRFLSPDPYVQTPENSQNFNRYSYCLNNPLKYTDKDGQFFLFTVFNAVTDAIGNAFAHGFNFKHYNWSRTLNAWKIDMGMFKGNIGQIVNKWTYGIINSVIGNEVSHTLNTIGLVDNVTDMDGMLALSSRIVPGSNAFTIGQYSIGPKGYVADWRDNLFVHEYGHYIQTQRIGALYFPIVAIPSVFSDLFTSKWSGMKHRERWFETNASKLGSSYFDKKYGSGAKGYEKGNPDYFDKGIFMSNDSKIYQNSPYINPRLGSNSQDQHYPVHTKRIVFWDFFL